MYDYLPWQLMQPAATTALLMEFMRWLTLWLCGVCLMMLVICLVFLTLEYWSQAREHRRSIPSPGLAESQPAAPAQPVGSATANTAVNCLSH